MEVVGLKISVTPLKPGQALAQNVAGHDHLAVILGERHEKGPRDASLGEDIVRSFPRWACESITSPFMAFGFMVSTRFLQAIARPFVFLKSLLGISFKKRFFGSTIDNAQIASGHCIDSTDGLRHTLSRAVEQLRLAQQTPDAQERIWYRILLQLNNYEREVDPLLFTASAVTILSEICRSLDSRAGEFSIFDRYVTMSIATSYSVALFFNILWLVQRNIPHRDQTMARNLVDALSQESAEPLLAIVGNDHSAGIVEKSQPSTREVALPRVS